MLSHLRGPHNRHDTTRVFEISTLGAMCMVGIRGIAWVIVATSTGFSMGCLSAGYEKDFQARLQEYKRQAAGEPAAAKPAAQPAQADAG
jgi:hypothetical protein